MSYFTNAEVLEYRGERRHISILLYDNKNKYHVLYAKTTDLDIKDEKEERSWYSEDHRKLWYALANRDVTINIPILPYHDTFYHVIDIDKKEDFELVDKVVSTLLED